MNWVLFWVIASTAQTDKILNTTTIPMATEELCNAAKDKLVRAYQQTQSPNYVILGESLRAK
jgi:hypothetical protein